MNMTVPLNNECVY